MTAALEGDEWSAARPGRTLPPGKTRYPFTGGWVGPTAGLNGRKNSSLPGFDPGPSSPVAQSLYRLSYRAHIMPPTLQNLLFPLTPYWGRVNV